MKKIFGMLLLSLMLLVSVPETTAATLDSEDFVVMHDSHDVLAMDVDMLSADTFEVTAMPADSGLLHIEYIALTNTFNGDLYPDYDVGWISKNSYNINLKSNSLSLDVTAYKDTPLLVPLV